MKSRSQKSGTQRPNTPRIHTKTNTKNNECLNTLQSLENIIINLKENNIDSTIQSIMQYFDNSYSYTFCATICEITFSFFCASTTFSLNLLLKFLNDFANTVNKENINIYKIFSKICIDSVNKDQYYYIMDKMIKEKLIDYNMVCPSIKKNSVYMAHYTYPKEFQFSEKRTSSIYDFIKRNKNLRENYWALHEEYVEEGHNPDKIAKIIRNDEVEKLQELSSQTNFNFNQCIDTSPYERFSFANTNIVKLIDYAAFFGSTKCFRYLLLNKADAYRTGKFAVAGGNLEIIHICEQNNSTFEDAYETAIMFHQNDIFKYLYENQIPGKINFNKDQTTKLLHNCVFYDNYEILLFLEEEGLKFDEVIIFDIMCKNNIFLIKHLFDMNGIPPYGFYLCARNGNVEIFNFLKKYKEININAKYQNGDAAIVIAANNNNLEIIEKFLNKRYSFEITNKDKVKSLFIAVNNGNIDIVKLLLTHVKINNKCRDEKENTLLIFACEKGNLELVKLFLQIKEIDINAKNKYGDTALMKASRSRNKEILNLILEQEGVDQNTQDKQGISALANAVITNNIEAIKSFLENKNVDVNEKDDEGLTILMLSIYKKTSINVFKLILENERIDVNMKNNDGQTALIYLISLLYEWKSFHDEKREQDFKKKLEILLQHKRIDVNIKGKDGQTALMFACRKNLKKPVELLLNHEKIDVNIKDKNGQTALMIACMYDYPEIVRLFLYTGGININDKDNRGWTTLTCSSIFNQVNNAKLLLEQGIDITIRDNDGINIIMLLAKTNEEDIRNLLEHYKSIRLSYVQPKIIDDKYLDGYYEIMKLILEQEKIDINEKDSKGKTTLMWACQNGYYVLVKLLLEQKGIDINTKSQGGNTALIFASSQGNCDVVGLLLAQKGIDINAKSKVGKTALIWAAEKYHNSVVKLLLEHGSDINAADNKGQTALIYATLNSDISVTKTLLENERINVNAVDNKGQTALICASKYGNIKIIEALLEHNGIDIHIKDKEGKSAQTYASSLSSKREQSDITKMLMGNSASKTKRSVTPRNTTNSINKKK